MSGSGVSTFPTKLDYYNTSSSGQYLCALLPVDARDIGINEESSVEWCLEEDSDADARYLKGVRTTEDGRLVRSVQPGRGSAAEFKVAIPPEFYKYDERSPFHGIEKGDDVILEIVESGEPHFRIYRTSDYGPRQIAVNPQIKAPVVAGIGLSILDQSDDDPSVSERFKGEYALTVSVFNGDERVSDASVTVGDVEKTTNSLGRNRFYADQGEYEIEVSYQGNTFSDKIRVSEKRSMKIDLDRGIID